MGAVLSHVISWPTLIIALLVFGFAPGALLRIIVLAYPREDARRRELRGELSNVPRLERLLWVTEQMELALFEGLGGRIGKTLNRYRIRQRIAERLRAEKDDFLHSSYTVGEHVVGFTMLGIPVYLLIYVHDATVIITAVALPLWFTFTMLRAVNYQHAKKKSGRGSSLRTTNRFDTLILFTLTPAVYLMTTYSFTRDLVMLSSGHFAGGYWAGVFVSLLALWLPWNSLIEAKRDPRIRTALANAASANR
jgi:hypothetical protein